MNKWSKDKFLEIRRTAEILHHLSSFTDRKARFTQLKKEIELCETCKMLKLTNPKTLSQYLETLVDKEILRKEKLSHKESYYQVVEKVSDRLDRILRLWSDHILTFVKERQKGRYLELPIENPTMALTIILNLTSLKLLNELRTLLTIKNPETLYRKFDKGEVNPWTKDAYFEITRHFNGKPIQEWEDYKKKLLTEILDQEQRTLFELTSFYWEKKYPEILDFLGEE